MRCIPTGKNCYTKERAEKYAERRAQTSLHGYIKKYKCAFCEYWHITHHRQKL